MFRLINLFLTSFLVVFFAISLLYSQAVVPQKHDHTELNKKGHLTVTSSEASVVSDKKFN
jgi:hypothetical protein